MRANGSSRTFAKKPKLIRIFNRPTFFSTKFLKESLNSKNKIEIISRKYNEKSSAFNFLYRIRNFLNPKGNYIVTCGALLHLTALTMSDMLYLRMFSISSSLCSLTFNLTRNPPLKLSAMWGSLFLCINSYMIISLLLDRKDVNFNSEQLQIYETWFLHHGITPRQFHRLIQMATFKDFPKNETIKQGIRDADHILFVIFGELQKTNSNEKIIGGLPGSIIGVKNFLSQTNKLSKSELDLMKDIDEETSVIEENSTKDFNSDETNDNEELLSSVSESVISETKELEEDKSVKSRLTEDSSNEHQAIKSIESKLTEIPVDSTVKIEKPNADKNETQEDNGILSKESNESAIEKASVEEAKLDKSKIEQNETLESISKTNKIKQENIDKKNDIPIITPIVKGISEALKRKTGEELFDDELENTQQDVSITLEYINNKQFSEKRFYTTNEYTRIMFVSNKMLQKWMEEDILFALPFTKSLINSLLSRIRSQKLDTKKDTYFEMMRICMTDGVISYKEKEILKSYQVISNISDETHAELLMKLGWTKNEYDNGKKNKFDSAGVRNYFRTLFG